MTGDDIEENEEEGHDAMEGEEEEESQEEYEKRMQQRDHGVIEEEEDLDDDDEENIPAAAAVSVEDLLKETDNVYGEEVKEEDAESDANIEDKFEKFLTGFKDSKGDYYYFERIKELYSREDKTVLVRYTDLPADLFDYFFKSRTAETNLKILTEATQMIFKDIYSTVDDDFIDTINAKLTIDDRDLVTRMRKINVRSLGRLVVFDSTIVSKTETKTTVKDRAWVCRECNQLHHRKVTECVACGSRLIRFSVALSKPISIEYIEVQELQEELFIGSSIPIQKTVAVYGDLTGRFKPGDSVRIIGIPKLEKTVSDAVLSKAISSEDDMEFSNNILFDDVIEAHNIELLGGTGDSIIENPSKLIEEVDRLQILALRDRYKNDEDLLDVLLNSFAPYIYGHTLEKFAIVLQAVGSIPISLDRNVVKKGEINILLVGDPGVTKSMMLEAAKTINLHAKYASGKGASGVGLTAGIDNDQKGMSKLRVGAVVLANNGVCCIDEFSHITPENKAHLLECMSQGTISINKGGINATLQAKTALLVATNPDAGKYQTYNSLKENVKITDQMFSRFDIIYVILDRVDEAMDSKIFYHIAAQYDKVSKRNQMIDRMADSEKKRLDSELLLKFVLYAKINNTKEISFTPDALKRIKSYYHELRKGTENDVTATPRQLEGIIRLCIALARLMLRDVVNEDDAIRIIKLLDEAFRSAGFVSSVSGGMKMTAEYSQPLHQMAKPLAFTNVMQKLTGNNKNPVEKEAVINELVKEAKWDLTFAYDFFDTADRKNVIYAPYMVKSKKVWLLSDSVYGQ